MIIISYIAMYFKYNKVVKTKEIQNESYDIKELEEIKEIPSNIFYNGFNLKKIIEANEKEVKKEKIEKKESDIEFKTQYRDNSTLAKGKIQVIQEGINGRQSEIVRKVYKGDVLISEIPITSEINQVSKDKIVEVGTAVVSNTYVPIAGDELKLLTDRADIKINPDEQSETIGEAIFSDKITLKDSRDDWYYIEKSGLLGWIKKVDLEYAKVENEAEGGIKYTKEQLTQDLGISMLLNKKSGLSLEQFKKLFENDSNDKNDVFKNIYQYFYFVEQQYGINGLFVAAIAIHESGFGTSALSMRTKNLFGYGAYDKDPSKYANVFEGYESGIDLVSRILMKYYLNPKGTPIYNNEIAVGTYFNGATVTGVNTSYASDKKWAEKVYKWMVYLYNKL